MQIGAVTCFFSNFCVDYVHHWSFHVSIEPYDINKQLYVNYYTASDQSDWMMRKRMEQTVLIERRQWRWRLWHHNHFFLGLFFLDHIRISKRIYMKIKYQNAIKYMRKWSIYWMEKTQKNNHKDTHTHKHSYNSNERKRRVKLLVCECKTSLQEDCAPKNLFGYWNLAPLKSQQRLWILQR